MIATDGNANTGEGAGNYADFDAIASVGGRDSLATGFFAKTDEGVTGGSAFGSWSQVTGNNGTAIGYSSLAGKEATALGYRNQASGDQSTAVGYNNVVSGANSGAVGSGNSVAANNTYVMGNNITVDANSSNSVVLGNGSVASGPNTVSVGAAGAERRITNVAAGEVSATSTDAINGSQLFASNQELRFDLNALRNDTNAGIASAAAIGTLPQAINPGKVALAIGSGLRSGEVGLAFGVSYRTEDDRGTVQGRIATDRGATTASLGLGIEF